MAATPEGISSFSISTFGCKLNQYESECIRQTLIKNNWTCRRFNEGADFYIVNSCTVTGKSDSRCRNAVRRAKKISPRATIIVTGCYAETQPGMLQAMPEVDIVVGNEDKMSIPLVMSRIISGMASGDYGRAKDSVEVNPTVSTAIEEFSDHSRAFIKVQEGCNESCSYCIIPRARGRSRSASVESVVRQVEILETNGYNEVVLTGTHIGRYDGGSEVRTELSDLIEIILERTDNVRIRLSSIEVNEVTPKLIDVMSRNVRVASHLHIPLQSGDDRILEAMNRQYKTKFFREKIQQIVASCGGIALGTDIIVGFPGETEENFRNTYELVKELPLSHFHVFNFSRRPQTLAAVMPDQVPPEVRKRRSKKLISLGKLKKRSFLRSLVGTDELVLIQGPNRPFSRFARSLTGNYSEVFVKCPSRLKGKLLPVRISHYSRGRLYGRLITECDDYKTDTQVTHR